MSFSAESVTASYPDSHRPAISELTFTVPKGAFLAVIGPNGSGKSTLLRVLLGALEPQSGSVCFESKPVRDWARAELARRVGVVTQSEEMPFALTVRELVAMGRYAHLGPLRAERAEDRAAMDAAMRRCDVAEFKDRSINTLSGGERQRARIARALAQTSGALVLDEPTAALDIAHEMRVFELLRTLAHEEARTIIVATHQLNLAARYADTLLLLDQGRLACFGSPAEVMQRNTLEPIYGWPVAVHTHVGPGFDTGAPQIAPLSRLTSERS